MIMIINKGIEVDKRRHIGIILLRSKILNYQLGLNHKFNYATCHKMSVLHIKPVQHLNNSNTKIAK